MRRNFRGTLQSQDDFKLIDSVLHGNNGVQHGSEIPILLSFVSYTLPMCECLFCTVSSAGEGVRSWESCTVFEAASYDRA